MSDPKVVLEKKRWKTGTEPSSSSSQSSILHTYNPRTYLLPCGTMQSWGFPKPKTTSGRKVERKLPLLSLVGEYSANQKPEPSQEKLIGVGEGGKWFKNDINGI